jgi:hypothetical protein
MAVLIFIVPGVLLVSVTAVHVVARIYAVSADGWQSRESAILQARGQSDISLIASLITVPDRKSRGQE